MSRASVYNSALLGIALTLAACAVAQAPPARPPTLLPAPNPEPEPDRSLYGPAIVDYTGEPDLRVRVGARMSRVVIDSAAAIEVRPPEGKTLALRGPLTVSRAADELVIQDGRKRRHRVTAPAVLVAKDGTSLATEGRSYPGRIELIAAGDEELDVINHVPVETYLPGVLDRELYHAWAPATFRAQAIAARSYALWEQMRHKKRHYDLESTTASQVYAGAVDNDLASQAVLRTLGQVLVYDGHIVPAFYSSSHGGASQDAVDVFPGVAPDIPPLRGGMRGSWDKDSPLDHWGPIYRHRDTLARRLSSWGRARGHAIATLDTIAAITVSKRGRSGRPVEFRVVDPDGVEYHLLAESFRHACNHEHDDAALSRQRRLKSSHVEVQVLTEIVAFSNGKGFGHGVGMSQWGAQGLALDGRDEAAILSFYYPGSTIETIYGL